MSTFIFSPLTLCYSVWDSPVHFMDIFVPSPFIGVFVYLTCALCTLVLEEDGKDQLD